MPLQTVAAGSVPSMRQWLLVSNTRDPLAVNVSKKSEKATKKAAAADVRLVLLIIYSIASLTIHLTLYGVEENSCHQPTD